MHVCTMCLPHNIHHQHVSMAVATIFRVKYAEDGSGGH